MTTVYVLTTGGKIDSLSTEGPGIFEPARNTIDGYLKLLRLPDCRVNVVPVMRRERGRDDRPGPAPNRWDGADHLEGSVSGGDYAWNRSHGRNGTVFEAQSRGSQPAGRVDRGDDTAG